MSLGRKFAWAKAVALLGLLAAAPCAGQAKDSPPRDHYDVAAFVWPAYHPDDRAKIFWPDGMGEWQTVMESTARFDGHRQPRRPLWGYIDEADPYVAEMEISAAADHGVNVFIFDWYWYDGRPFLEGHLNDGYLKARNNDRVKFYLMWANHDAGMMWDRRNSDDAWTQKNRAAIWDGAVDRKQFDIITTRIINNYFKNPSYYKIDGKPVFMIYELGNLIEGLGGVEEARAALDAFRQNTRQAGFPGLELQAILYGSRIPLKVHGIDQNQVDIVKRLGFDSTTNYQFLHFADVRKPYGELLKDVSSAWQNFSGPGMPAYYPHVTIGWDTSPRLRTVTGPIMKDSAPENFEAGLRAAKAFVDAHPRQARLITVNSWNEWTESSYLMPDTEYRYQYLDAVKRVFGANGQRVRQK